MGFISAGGKCMRAAFIKAFGGIDNLSIQDTPAPVPANGEVLIKVEASTVGFADTLTRRGMYPPGLTEAGIIPGGEVVGRIVAAGSPEVQQWVGQRVYAITGMGGHAELAVVPVENLMPLSKEYDPQIVAGFGVASIVAQAALERANVGSGKTVLVRGAAGGVGLAVVRLAQLAGAKVLATASSPDRAEYLRRLGVSEVLDRDGTAQEATCSADIVVDPVGGPAVATFMSMLRPNGIYILMGVAGGIPGPEIGEALLADFFRSITLSVFSLHSVAMPQRSAILAGILENYASGRIEPDIDGVISLDDIRTAHERIEAGENCGRIVLAF